MVMDGVEKSDVKREVGMRQVSGNESGNET